MTNTNRQTYDHLATLSSNISSKFIVRINQILKKVDNKHVGIMSKKGEALTKFDIQIEKALSKIITDNYPHYVGIVGEEISIGKSSYKYVFFIDPIDGTKNFIRGNPLFAVSVGLWDIENMTPLYGLVYAPNLNETYEWQFNKVSTLNGHKINVSNTKLTSESIIGASFTREKKQYSSNWVRMAKYYKKISSKVYGFRMLQCDSLTLAWIACGRLDGAILMATRPFDIAGGLAIVTGAGGNYFCLGKVDNPLCQVEMNIVVSNGKGLELM